jgi:SAM-dependent methyltransferase
MLTSTDPICVTCREPNSRVFWSDENRTIRQCRLCGLLYVFPQPDRTTLHDQFQSDYFTGGRSDGPSRLKLEFEAWRRPTIARIASRIRALKPAGKLLDVGCASGEMFAHFPAASWEIFGIEPSVLAFARAHERFANNPRIRLFNSYLSDVSFPAESLDVITVLESLYYMRDPRHELSHLARILRDDGLLAIAMPGYTYQRLRHSGPMSYALAGRRCSLTPSHLFYFSEYSLSTLLKSEGFRICETIQLGSSSYGSGVGRFARQAYLKFSEVLGSVTRGRINLAPHVLYLCRKSDQA